MAVSILVLYYSQSGQLGQILDNLVSNIKDQAEITMVEYQPEQDFPFPWAQPDIF